MKHKSIQAADAALQALRDAEAAHRRARHFTNERILTTFELQGAQAAVRAALRLEKTPRVECFRCKRRLKPQEPLAWQRHFRSVVPVCLRCEHHFLSEETQSCVICSRVMHYEWRTSRHPLTCSYQCAYRHKRQRQRERTKVVPTTVACAVCLEMFTQARSDAKTCSNACRQKLFRRNANR